MGPRMIFKTGVGCEGICAALSVCSNFYPCHFMPLIHFPHLCDKSSYFVHTHLNEGADQPCAQTELSRAERTWDGAGDGGCHGNPSLCCYSLPKLWYQIEAAWSNFYQLAMTASVQPWYFHSTILNICFTILEILKTFTHKTK